MLVDYFIRLEDIKTGILYLKNNTKLNINFYNNKKLEKIISIKKNSTNHKHYSYYYNEELIKLVEEKDKMILNMFNYKFESFH